VMVEMLFTLSRIHTMFCVFLSVVNKMKQVVAVQFYFIVLIILVVYINIHKLLDHPSKLQSCTHLTCLPVDCKKAPEELKM